MGRELRANTNVVYQAMVYLSRRLGPHWPDLYRALPISPGRSLAEREKDIRSSVNLQSIGNGPDSRAETERSASEVADSMSTSAVLPAVDWPTGVRQNPVHEQKSALRCLQKWLFWNRNASVEQLAVGLKAVGRSDLVLELLDSVDRHAARWAR